MRTILYTNENTKTCIWECETHTFTSHDKTSYNVMSVAHERVDGTRDIDLVQGIRMLLKANGELIDKN